MGTLQENQSLNAEYERNKKEREMKEEIDRLSNIINNVISHIDIKIARALNEEDYNIDTDDLVDLRSELIGSDKE